MYTKQSWADGPGGGTPVSAARLGVMEQGIADANTNVLTPTGVKTAAYNAQPGELVPCDTTSGGFAVTLPSAPPNLTRVAVKLVTQSGANAVTLNRGGTTDVFNKTGGNTSVSVSALNQLVEVQYASGVWYVVNDSFALASLQAMFQGLASFVDLSAVAATSTASGTGVGDKLSLYSNYGFGIQAGRMVAYIGPSSGFSVRTAAGSGQKSSGTDIWSVDTLGHVLAPGVAGTPTAAMQTGAGTTPPAAQVNAAAKDARGSVTFGTGTATTAGNQITVTFANAYAVAPNVSISETTAATALLGPYVAAVTTTGFTVGFATAPAVSQGNAIYGFAWQALG